jgi:hypothetical protein
MRRRLSVAVLGLGMAGLACGQSGFRLKSQSVPARAGTYEGGRLISLSKTPGVEGVEHFILEVNGPVDSELVNLLTAHRVHVLGYIPENGVSVSISDKVSLQDLPLVSAGKLGSEEKLSPLLRRITTGPVFVIAQFHPDIEAEGMRQIVSRTGIEWFERPGLLSSQLLVKGGIENLAKLAEDDAVQYIFPASTDVISGTPIAACSSGQTVAGQGVPNAPTFGDGWDGPGLNATSVSYSFGPMTPEMPASFIQSEVLRALTEWTKYIQVTFWQNSNRTAKRNIDIWFASADHGDGLPFASLNTLAHTFYPASPNPESIAGDMHLNAGENWAVGGQPDVFSLALHETGHALGLGHSDDPADIMYAIYQRASGLTPDDVASVRTLYAARPDPALSIVANGQSSALPAKVTAHPLPLTGTVDGGLGDVKVSWMTSNGVRGVAEGGRTWSIGSIPLHPGANTIQLTATDGDGNSATLPITVDLPFGKGSRVPPPAPVVPPSKN